MTASLFTACVLPGCREMVASVGDACPGCIASFGDMLRPTDRPPLTQAQIDERDRYVALSYQAQRDMAARSSR